MAYDDHYDKEKYISKGYIMPDGTLVGKAYDILPDGSKREKPYTRFHADMAEEYIKTHHAKAFENDIIADYKDHMLCRLGAIQVLSVGRPIIIYCKGHQNRFISDAIVSYLEHGWKERALDNPYGSYFEYIRTHLINCGSVPFDKRFEQLNVAQLNVLLKELGEYVQTTKDPELKANWEKRIAEAKAILEEKEKQQQEQMQK